MSTRQHADRPATTAPEPDVSARRASLAYVSDEEPGFRRKRAGKGFFYIDARGKRITDPAEIDRIDAIVIPPAWTDVWISPDSEGHIQATGRDDRGRKQYRYHPRWTAFRDEAKYATLADFARTLPKLRERVDADLRKREVPRERVVALIVWLLDNTMIRVGNSAYARDNNSFGLTTLKAKHLEIEGSKLRFEFKGKSGKEWRLQLTDRRLARVMRTIQDLPGQRLFQYVNGDGVRRAVTSQDVNDYIREATGADFTSKHFRTWGGTISAAALFEQTPVPDSQRGKAREMNAIIDKVAERLGNTRAVCRQCYIHPAVMDSWSAGTLPEEMKSVRRSVRKPFAGLDLEETIVLKWLIRFQKTKS